MVPIEGKAGGLFSLGNQKEVTGAPKRYGEALIDISIEPGVVFWLCNKREPKWLTTRPLHHSIENSPPISSLLMFGETKSRPTNSGC
jgi:hypothetical protein